MAARNILHIMTDEQVHTWLGAMGNTRIRTPNLDRLVRDGGLLFENATCCNGVCVPARCSMMTGRFPIAHGVAQNRQLLAAHEETIGSLFSAGGYMTGYFGKTHFGRDDNNMAASGWRESFIWHKQYNAWLREQGVDIAYPEGGNIRSKTRYWNIGPSNIPPPLYFENAMTDHAIRFLEAHRADPFFCFVSYVAPHGPFTPPPPYDAMYNPDDMKLEPRFETELDDMPPAFVKWATQNQKYVNEEELRIYRAHVYGLVSLVDDNVGRLIAVLKEQGLYESTLISFTSDHGDFGTRFGILGKSWNSLDCVMRVPLIFSIPGQRVAARRTPALAQHVDLLPTYLEYAGLPVPKKVQGRSLWPLFTGDAESVRDAAFAYNQNEYTGGYLAESMIRTERWKYIQAQDHVGQLYDLEADPWETRNLAVDPACGEVVLEMKDRLLRWHVECSGAYFPTETARFWEDETNFYDETLFRGERTNVRGNAPV